MFVSSVRRGTLVASLALLPTLPSVYVVELLLRTIFRFAGAGHERKLPLNPSCMQWSDRLVAPPPPPMIAPTRSNSAPMACSRCKPYSTASKYMAGQQQSRTWGTDRGQRLCFIIS
jgi:hypothetical protein